MKPPLHLPLLQYLILFVFIFKFSFSHEETFENSIIGDPGVQCGIDSIIVSLRTAHPFTGRFMVEGESERPGCSQSHVKTPSTRPVTEFRIKFGECNMRRQRTLNPRGVAYSFTLIASFHSVFVTGLDRAFHIQCFFTEAVKAVESSLDVRKLTTQIIQREFSLPQCNYRLREGFGGPPIRFASVGAPVTHVWQCDELAGLVYGVLIHSCYVDDAHGNRFALIDDRGCAIDRFLLKDLSYGPEAISAHVDSHVFKYADRVQLFFTCTVQLCFKDDGGCDGITPPQCGQRHHFGPPTHGGPVGGGHLSIPPGLHRRPIPSFVNSVKGEEMPPGFPRPKNIEYPPAGGGPQQQQQQQQYGGPFKNGDFFGPIQNRRPPPPGRGRSTESGAAPFGVAGYEISPFGSPFKDSPLNNETETESSSLIDDINNATAEAETAKRTSREAKQMESDLSVELTVIPMQNEMSGPLKDPFDAGILRPKNHCFTLPTILIFSISSLIAIFLSSVLTALILTKKFLNSTKLSRSNYNY